MYKIILQYVAKSIFWFYGVTLVQAQLKMAQINIINECQSQRLNRPYSFCDGKDFTFAELKISFSQTSLINNIRNTILI